MIEFVARRLLHTALVTVAIVKNLYAGQGRPMSGGVARHRLRLQRRAEARPLRAGACAQAEAGFGGGIDVILLSGSGTMVNDKRLPEAIADVCSKVGILPTGLNGKYRIGSQPGQRFHDVMEQARYTLDARRRRELYTEATRIVHEDKPWLELLQEVVLHG